MKNTQFFSSVFITVFIVGSLLASNVFTVNSKTTNKNIPVNPNKGQESLILENYQSFVLSENERKSN